MNLSRFDLLSIRLGLCCVQTGSLSEAAAQCHLALAAASRRIRELEDALGVALFERHARGLRPTEAGRAFARHALDLLQTVDHLGQDLHDLRLGIARHIRLCASTAAINQFLPPLLARHAQAHPGCRVDLEEQVSAEVVRSLREGRCDLGIFVEGPDTGTLQTHVFRHDELILVLYRGHPLARSTRPVAFSDTLDADWIGLNTGAAVLQRQQETAQALHRPLRMRMQVRSFDAVCHLVASGLGIALLPRAAVMPMIRAMGLLQRSLSDPWAQRRLLLALGAGAAVNDPAMVSLTELLLEPTQNAKPRARKRQ